METKLRCVEVTYECNTVITTSMAAGLTDSEIIDYFKIGRLFNIGNVEDNLKRVKSINILN